jgi:hypothetical protein
MVTPTKNRNNHKIELHSFNYGQDFEVLAYAFNYYLKLKN